MDNCVLCMFLFSTFYSRNLLLENEREKQKKMYIFCSMFLVSMWFAVGIVKKISFLNESNYSKHANVFISLINFRFFSTFQKKETNDHFAGHKVYSFTRIRLRTKKIKKSKLFSKFGWPKGIGISWKNKNKQNKMRTNKIWKWFNHWDTCCYLAYPHRYHRS